MAEKKELSLCVLSRNEDDCLAACLETMRGAADEILVIDLGSGGRVSELAAGAGATLYRPAWENTFGGIRNFALERAAGRWVLFLSADETIPPRQHARLRLLLQNPNAEGYLFRPEGGMTERPVTSPAQWIRLIRNRAEYRFRYRSYPFIPDEILYSLQGCPLRIDVHGGAGAVWRAGEESRLLGEDRKERPEDGYLCYLEGIGRINRGEYERAATLFEAARKTINWGYLCAPHLYRCLGISLMAARRYEQAEEVLRAGIQDFSFYHDLLVLRAELYLRLGRRKEAAADLETCLALRKKPNPYVPPTEIGDAAIEEMLKKIIGRETAQPAGNRCHGERLTHSIE